MVNTLVYWIGIIGIPGKGPHYMETYNPDRTIGQIIQTMTTTGLVERNKRCEMFKFQPGNINKYNVSDPHWSITIPTTRTTYWFAFNYFYKFIHFKLRSIRKIITP